MKEDETPAPESGHVTANPDQPLERYLRLATTSFELASKTVAQFKPIGFINDDF